MKEIKCRTKAGKLKVRGLFKTKLFAFNVGIAINFGRVYRYLTGPDGINAPNGENIVTNLLSGVHVFASTAQKLFETLIISIFAYSFKVGIKYSKLQQLKY